MKMADIAWVFANPAALFRRVAQDKPSARMVFWGYALWLGMMPPLCAFIGVSVFGWHFGVGEPIYISAATALAVSAAYYAALLIGYAVAVRLTRWMAPTYGADTHLGLHAALVGIVGTPLMIGGVLHLYPLLPLNLLCLIPAILWSAYLLYTGIPALFGIETSRGMLMASSILGVFFVAAIGLAALTMVLWTHGIGPDLGFDWRSAVAG